MIYLLYLESFFHDASDCLLISCGFCVVLHFLAMHESVVTGQL